MSSEKRKIAYIDGKPYEIGANHTSILNFVKSYIGEKKFLLFVMIQILLLTVRVEFAQLR